MGCGHAYYTFLLFCHSINAYYFSGTDYHGNQAAIHQSLTLPGVL